MPKRSKGRKGERKRAELLRLDALIERAGGGDEDALAALRAEADASEDARRIIEARAAPRNEQGGRLAQSDWSRLYKSFEAGKR